MMVSVFTRKVMVQSNSWNRPRPGHRPRLEPRKLRKSFQLNLFIDVLLTLTVLEKPKENPEMFEFLKDSNPSSTVTVVLRIESFRTVFYLKFFIFVFQNSLPSSTVSDSPRLAVRSRSWLEGGP